MATESTSGPPPTYVHEGGLAEDHEAYYVEEPQIVILPASDALQFQHGYLGADGERAAIEGELQVKAPPQMRWRKLTVGVRTTETAYEHAIELLNEEIALYDADTPGGGSLPAEMPFAIPLTVDTPQCVHTPQSSLAHVLTAVLHPVSPTLPPLTKTIEVHTRRFTPHSRPLPVAPVRRVLHHPARIDVELPRTTFFANEPVPVYVTVPPPRRELVVDEGLRLRNVKAELVRMVRVRDLVSEQNDVLGPHDESESDSDELSSSYSPSRMSTQSVGDAHKLAGPSTSSSAFTRVSSRRDDGALYSTVISRSGALCRFHATLPVRLRFILQQSSPSSSPLRAARPLQGECGPFGSGDTQCASVTQSTLLHSVSFCLRILATFRHTGTHTERVCALSIPITILPSPAPPPEVEPSADRTYRKKHDAPPARTVRGEEADAAPHYEEGEAGPSVVASGAPPPFDERDAPPPFSDEASSSQLPTFQQSESDRRTFASHSGTPEAHEHDTASHHVIEGEGILFGFPAASQFSGHSEEMTRGGDTTPPPTLEQATLDTDVTALAQLDLGAPEHAIHVLGLALQQHEAAAATDDPLPPPPPPLDDPADPPPSIDQAYRSREGVAHQTSRQSLTPPTAPASTTNTTNAVFAPPPYPTPDGEREQEHVSHPPPYVDFMPRDNVTTQ